MAVLIASAQKPDDSALACSMVRAHSTMVWLLHSLSLFCSGVSGVEVSCSILYSLRNYRNAVLIYSPLLSLYSCLIFKLVSSSTVSFVKI